MSRRGSPVLGCVGGSEIKTRRRFGWADGGGFGDEEEANAATVQSAIKMASACVCVCVCVCASACVRSNQRAPIRLFLKRQRCHIVDKEQPLH